MNMTERVFFIYAQRKMTIDYTKEIRVARKNDTQKKLKKNLPRLEQFGKEMYTLHRQKILYSVGYGNMTSIKSFAGYSQIDSERKLLETFLI